MNIFMQLKLSTSQKQAVISLLDKGTDRYSLQNWRPISLLNTDYKIISKVLAERIKYVLPSVISNDQSGYLKGRNITDNIRAVNDVLHLIKQQNKSGILLCLDFKKAFDSLNLTFMEAVLEKVKFGGLFRQWIKILYTNITSCVINKNITSNYFNVLRGVRQGDPLSPYLFILAVEILSKMIHANNDIQGIKLKSYNLKTLEYADDVIGFVQDEKSAKALFETVKLAGTFSGL